MALEHWLTLSLTSGLGPTTLRRLIQLTGSAQAACDASINDLRRLDGIAATKASSIHNALRQAPSAAQQELARAKQHNVRLISPDEADYPPLLQLISDPPSILYIRGTLEPRDLNAIAIVGSRQCSYYGREQAERLAALLAGAGFTIISGGARGTDSAAHRGALTNPLGRTIAILGCGVDITYPPENHALFQQISQRGAILSEYPMGTPPLNTNFPRRNRIISGLSRGVLVIEAGERSGAMITARLAADDHNRPVFALPGRIDNPVSDGPHQLIRQGATLVRRLEDILDGLDPLPAQITQPDLFSPANPDTDADSINLTPAPANPDDATTDDADAHTTPTHQSAEPSAPTTSFTLSASQQALLQCMTHHPSTVDILAERSGIPISTILRDLTFLSLKGLITRTDGQQYALHNTGHTKD